MPSRNKKSGANRGGAGKRSKNKGKEATAASSSSSSNGATTTGKKDRSQFFFDTAVSVALILVAIVFIVRFLSPTLRNDEPAATTNNNPPAASQQEQEKPLQPREEPVSAPATTNNNNKPAASIYASYGVKLLNSGKVDEAIEKLREGLAIYPDDIAINLNLGNALATSSRWPEALNSYKRTVELTDDAPQLSRPRHRAQALAWAGVSHLRLGDTEEAVRWLERSVAFYPTHESRRELATALQAAGRYADAARETASSMAMSEKEKAGFGDRDYNTLSQILSVLQCWDLLERALKHCLEGGGCSVSYRSYPLWRIHLEYGVALKQNGKQEEAEKQFKKAAAGRTMEHINQYMEKFLRKAENERASVAALGRGDIDSDGTGAPPEVRDNLTQAFEPIFGPGARKTPAWSYLEPRHLNVFKWPIDDSLVGDVRTELEAQKATFAKLEGGGNGEIDLSDVVRPFPCQFLPVFTLEDCIFALQVYQRALRSTLPNLLGSIPKMFSEDFDRNLFGKVGEGTPLRIGLFSSDLRAHPMLPLIRAFLKHGRSGSTPLRVTLYYAQADPGVLDSLREYVNDSVECHKTDIRNCLQHARMGSVQVWLETAGPTGRGIPSLAAAGPAPVGVLWAGFPGSLADENIQYIVTDRYTVPPGSDAAKAYPEHPIYVPSWMIASKPNLPNVDSDEDFTREGIRSKCGIPTDAVVYSYFGRLWKVDDVTFKSWAETIRLVPNSYLVILDYLGSDQPSTAAIDSIRSSWTRIHNLDPNRLKIIPPFEMDVHIRAMQALSDVALDTAMYGGGTTSYEAILAGLPLVHRPGGFKMMQRAGGSILHAAGLSDVLICEDVDDYVQVAVRLGTDREFYLSVKQRVEDAIAGRGDAVLFRPQVAVEALVRGLKQAYELWLEGHPPRDIFVDEGNVDIAMNANGGIADEL